MLQNTTELKAGEIRDRVRFMVITQGKEGALVYADGKKFTIPVFPEAQILDPTGVGDAFRGGFLRGFGLKLDWQTCGQMGSLGGHLLSGTARNPKPYLHHRQNLLNGTEHSMMTRAL